MKHESYILHAESLRLVWDETWKLAISYMLNPLGWCGMKHESYILHAESLKLVWMKHESYILHAESLRLVWTKYESYILHASAVMYTFQNLNTAINDKVWPYLDLSRRSNKLRKACVLLKGPTLR